MVLAFSYQLSAIGCQHVCHCFAEAVLFAKKYERHCFREAVAHSYQSFRNRNLIRNRQPFRHALRGWTHDVATGHSTPLIAES